MRSKVEHLANAFEKEFGPDCLFRACLSTINSILVDKGVCTKEELEEQFIEQVEKGVESLTKTDEPSNPDH
jgi:hypothetical protein